MNPVFSVIHIRREKEKEFRCDDEDNNNNNNNNNSNNGNNSNNNNSMDTTSVPKLIEAINPFIATRRSECQ